MVNCVYCSWFWGTPYAIGMHGFSCKHKSLYEKFIIEWTKLCHNSSGTTRITELLAKIKWIQKNYGDASTHKDVKLLKTYSDVLSKEFYEKFRFVLAKIRMKISSRRDWIA